MSWLYRKYHQDISCSDKLQLLLKPEQIRELLEPFFLFSVRMSETVTCSHTHLHFFIFIF